jgi:hypothetical protein
LLATLRHTNAAGADPTAGAAAWQREPVAIFRLGARVAPAVEQAVLRGFAPEDIAGVVPAADWVTDGFASAC